MASANFIRFQLIGLIKNGPDHVHDERIVALDNIHEIKPNGNDGKANYVLRGDVGTLYETNHQFDTVLKAIADSVGVAKPA